MDTKERILTLLQYLKENTDEENAATNVSIRNMFRELGESVSIPTLRDDIASLRKCGYDIDVNERNGVGTAEERGIIIERGERCGEEDGRSGKIEMLGDDLRGIHAVEAVGELFPIPFRHDTEFL